MSELTQIVWHRISACWAVIRACKRPRAAGFAIVARISAALLLLVLQETWFACWYCACIAFSRMISLSVNTLRTRSIFRFIYPLGCRIFSPDLHYIHIHHLLCFYTFIHPFSVFFSLFKSLFHSLSLFFFIPSCLRHRISVCDKKPNLHKIGVIEKVSITNTWEFPHQSLVWRKVNSIFQSSRLQGLISFHCAFHFPLSHYYQFTRDLCLLVCTSVSVCLLVSLFVCISHTISLSACLFVWHFKNRETVQRDSVLIFEQKSSKF